MDRRSVLSSGWAGLVALACLESLPRNGWAAELNQKDAGSAIRTALERGAQVAVAQLGVVNGFLANDKVRIRLPQVLEQAEPVLRAVGRGRQLEELVTSMNHAAESAVALAQPLLRQAIRRMTLEDALLIVQGGDNAVTDYFSTQTREPLTHTFQPVVARAVDRLSLARAYDDLARKANRLGLIRGGAVTVQEHVTAKALDGLYFVIGEEERRIRRDPVGTGSNILRKVFGAL